MLHCSRCAAQVPETAQFCPACGALLSSVSQAPTAVATPSGSGRSQSAATEGLAPAAETGRVDANDPAFRFPGSVTAMGDHHRRHFIRPT